MSRAENENWNYKLLAASGVVMSGNGYFGGLICSTSSSGTLTLYDNTTNSGAKIVDTMPLVAGQFYRIPVNVEVGLYAVIGGTASITFFK